MKYLTIIAALIAMILVSNGSAATLVGLGDLPGGVVMSRAMAISADGSAVVGVSESAGTGGFSRLEAFRWTAQAGMSGLGDLPGGYFDSSGLGVSSDGSVVVGTSSYSVNLSEAFRWTESDGMTGLDFLRSGPAPWVSVSRGVSASGAVITGFSSYSAGISQPTAYEAFRWVAGTGMMGLGKLPGASRQSSAANGVSADGSSIIGWSLNALGHKEAFLWTRSGGMVGLGDESDALAISSDGTVIVGERYSTSGSSEPFRWTKAGGIVGLGGRGKATAASEGGRVIVGTWTEAFIWDPVAGRRNLKDFLVTDFGLDLTGWTLSAATGISADGSTIVGYGTNPDGNQEAWMARTSATIPEASSCLTWLVLGLVVILPSSVARQQLARSSQLHRYTANIEMCYTSGCH